MNATERQKSVTVLGAGSYGTALAICIARKGVPTLLWGRDEQAMRDMAKTRQNARYLGDIQLPEALTPCTDLAKAVAASSIILVVVPSYGFAEVLKQIKPHLRADARVAWATKGLEPETGRLLSDVATEILGPTVSLAILSGPTFAKENGAGHAHGNSGCGH